MLRAPMRSSPSFLVVSRRGLGVHFVVERYGPSVGSSLDRKGVRHEIDAFSSPALPKRKQYSRKTVFVAVFGILQGLMIVIGEIFNLFDYLS
jgi:hypothetical protein